MGIELFERTATADGRLLKVEQLVEPNASQEPGHGIGFLLTFDVGRILVVPDRERGCLAMRHLPSAAEELRLVSLAEEEPWWKVMGNTLTRVWPGGQGQGAVSSEADPTELRVQFRADDENPKVIVLGYDEGRVRVGEMGREGPRSLA